MKFVNLGCGNRFIEGSDWINIDFRAFAPSVIECNLLAGIPLDPDSVDFVYHSHVLEHLSKDDGIAFVKECYRVLKPKGVIRIAVPDLENLAKNYLANLDKVSGKSDQINEADYRWSVIELLDQMVRTESGGEMKKYWQSDELINEEYIRQRMGFEFVQYRLNYVMDKTTPVSPDADQRSSAGVLSRLARRIYRAIRPVDKGNTTPDDARSRGEVHRWMYDRHSLANLLTDAGFREIAVTDAFSSRQLGWETYRSLDVENGAPRKPDSLFIEACK